MIIEFKSVKPNLISINYELLFTFKVSKLKPHIVPIQFEGELFSEDGKKIGNLMHSNRNPRAFYLNPTFVPHPNENDDFELQMICELSEKAVSHIENFRSNKSEATKGVSLTAHITYNCILSNTTIATLHLGENDEKSRQYVLYKFANPYQGPANNMNVLSSAGQGSFLHIVSFTAQKIAIHIDLMQWINTFTEYLNIGNFLIFEFVQPDATILSDELKARYDKAQNALLEMRRQLNYGEWKLAVICIRPIFELFKNFDSFKSFLIENGYTEPAVKALSDSMKSFFDLVSKFYHALDERYREVNPDIPVQREDAYLAYSNCVTLLHLISEKLKRKEFEERNK